MIKKSKISHQKIVMAHQYISGQTQKLSFDFH